MHAQLSPEEVDMPQNNNNDLGVLTAKMTTLHEDVIEIKAALRQLSDAITKLALVEERQTQAAAALERAFLAIDKVEARLAAIETNQPDQKRAAKWLDRAVLALIGALAAMFAKKVGLL